MPETIDCTNRDAPGFFVIAAITKIGELAEPIFASGKMTEICMTVNGIEIPFTETINDIFSRMEEDIDLRALKKAEQMVTDAGLDNLRDTLQEAEWKIKEALKNGGFSP